MSTVFTLVYSLYANMIILFTLFIFTSKHHRMPSTVKQSTETFNSTPSCIYFVLCLVT